MSIITLCASHIRNMDDIIRLNEMIESHNNQTIKSKLYISISYDSDNLLEGIIKLQTNDVILYIRDKPTSQFMHYKMLANESSNIYKDIHVLFTDDDDILDPIRNETYLKFIKNDIIRIKSVVRFYDYIGFNKSNINRNQNTINEYVNICIRLNILCYILNNVSDDELNKWAFDCQFNCIVTSFHKTYEHLSYKPLYYYRYHILKPTRYYE